MPAERLQKLIAAAGLASRRHAEVLIREGRVTVNGAVITILGAKADPAVDDVRVDGRPLRAAAAHTYLAMHKPRGVITTASDERGRRTVLDLLPRAGPRLFPIGRLDRDSEGLLLLTDDGDLALRLTHRRYGGGGPLQEGRHREEALPDSHAPARPSPSPSPAGRGDLPSSQPAGDTQAPLILNLSKPALSSVEGDEPNYRGGPGHARQRASAPPSTTTAYAFEKEYLALVEGDLDGPALDRLRAGVPLDGRPTAPAVVEPYERRGAAAKDAVGPWYRVVLREGRNRQVRRMFESQGARVTRLVRVRVGPVLLGDLRPGRVRPLTRRELDALGVPAAPVQTRRPEEPRGRPGRS